MFDILIYLFKHFGHSHNFPHADQLLKQLMDAGFEEEEIESALEWLDELGCAIDIRQHPPYPHNHHVASRVYAAKEQAQLGIHAIEIIVFLETAGVIDASMRELIIERASAEVETPISIDEFKIIVLWVLLHMNKDLDLFMLDEFFIDHKQRTIH